MANFPLSLLTLYILSARYRRLIGNMAEQIIFCAVAAIVSLALARPMFHSSARLCADSLRCHCLSVKVSLAGVNSGKSSKSEVCWQCTALISRPGKLTRLGSIFLNSLRIEGGTESPQSFLHL